MMTSTSPSTSQRVKKRQTNSNVLFIGHCQTKVLPVQQRRICMMDSRQSYQTAIGRLPFSVCDWLLLPDTQRRFLVSN